MSGVPIGLHHLIKVLVISSWIIQLYFSGYCCFFPFVLNFYSLACMDFFFSFLLSNFHFLTFSLYLLKKSFMFSFYFLFVIFFSNELFLRALAFYKQTKTRSCKTMVVLPSSFKTFHKGFMKDSYSFSFETFLFEIDGAWSSFCFLVNWNQA